ncbi:hypothetical protein GE061_010354 [Apolygus lucorum]|uniref:Uncharacterized protein n=1 Tax=Apolygus lucorum TaxID=248454 RepID=A0A8S9Y4U3_APOLU|nr:hypothetical protein GE061_010354 [Apolygus lucorum]
MTLTSWLMYLDSLGDPHYRRSSLFTAEFVERVLQSVFHTITIVAVYEIIKETFRRIEVIRLRCKVRKYEMMIQNCCLRMYGCRTCYNRFRQSAPTITYRSVPPSTYRALENKVVLWKAQKIPDCYLRYWRRGDSREEIQSTTRYLCDLSAYMRELCAEQDYEIKENFRKYEMMLRRREEDRVLEALKEKRMCPCVAVQSPCNKCNPRQSISRDPYL